ncbi:MAG: hypothetical protein IPM96_02435 [Ignavibacteria bacterium]|nr:hypothetical protein [Ignavibacteria bacterium]
MKFIIHSFLILLTSCLLKSNFVYSQNGWQQQTSGTSATLLGAVMTDLNTAYTCGLNGLIIKTTNGGNNWFTLNTNTGRFLRDITSAGFNTLYAVGEMGIVLRTTNGGSNWITQLSGTDSTLVHVKFS